MKTIAIVLFAAITLSSCGGEAQKCEEVCNDSTAVVTTTVAPVATDSTAVDTSAVK